LMIRIATCPMNLVEQMEIHVMPSVDVTTRSATHNRRCAAVHGK
jgi:hypothetical protein